MVYSRETAQAEPQLQQQGAPQELLDECRLRLADPLAKTVDFEQLAYRLVNDLLYDENFLAQVDLPALLDQLKREGRAVARRAGGAYPLTFDYELANAALLAGHATLAGELLTEALPQWPDDVGLLALAAEQAMATGHWNLARQHLERGRTITAAQEAPGSIDRVMSATLKLEQILFDVRLGRADRALLELDALLKRGGEPAEIRRAAQARKIDLLLLVDRADDALAAIDAVPQEEFSADLAATRVIAQSAVANRDDVDATLLLDQLEALPHQQGISKTPVLIARLAAAELALRIGQPDRARAAIDAMATELPRQAAANGLFLRERAWARAIEGRLGRPDATSTERPGATAFAMLLDEWRMTPLLPGGISFLRSGARRLVIHAALAAAGDDLAAFELLLAAQTMGSLARQLELPAPTLPELRRELLAAGEVLLTWLPTTDATHLFLVDATRVRHFTLPSERETRDVANALASARGVEARRPHLAALAAALLPDEVRVALAGARHAWLCGSELLEGVPLLELEVAPGVRLGAQLPIAELPSLPVALWLRRRPRATREAGIDAWVGPETSLNGKARFTFDREKFAETVPTLRYVEGDGSAAGERSSFGQELGRRLAHDVGLFVAHGVIDRHRDRFAGLLLLGGDDPERTVAWADAFERATLPPFLVMAACSAGEAPNRIGEDGGEHLGGAALIGGARCVVLGRGMLSAGETLPELVTLLRGVTAGEPPATALWQARRERPADQPFVGLAVIGLGDEPLRERSGDDECPALFPNAIAGAAHRGIGGSSIARVGAALLLLGGGWLLLASGRRRAAQR